MRKVFTLLCALVSLSAFCAIPSGYYSTLNGKNLSALKDAVHDVVTPHTQFDYNQLWSEWRYTDVKKAPNGEDMWWDMYSANIYYVKNGSRGMNREHSLPKSWWGGDVNVAYTDINHLYPSDAVANEAKNNYPLGEVGEKSFDNGVTKVGRPVTGQGGGAAYVFEPADEYKGDFARTYFYMACAYQHLKWKYTYMMQNNTYPSLSKWAIDLLLKWHRQDPVSQKEIDRNEGVYKRQGNRNPFIDYPNLCEYIWGNMMGKNFDEGGGSGEPEIFSPAANTDLDFDGVALGKTKTITINVKGTCISGSLSAMLYGTNKDCFAISTKTMPGSTINTAGFPLVITYNPKSLGKHECKIAFYDGGLSGSFIINVTGECFAVPTLSTLTAENASVNITDHTYTAHWTAAPEEIDYYIVTRTKYYDNGTYKVEEFVSDENYYDFDDLNDGINHTYSVQSFRLGYRSAASNVISVVPGGVSAVKVDHGIAIYPAEGGVSISSSEIHKNLRIVNIHGAVATSIKEFSGSKFIELPIGIYIVTSDNMSKPFKLVIKN